MKWTLSRLVEYAPGYHRTMHPIYSTLLRQRATWRLILDGYRPDFSFLGLTDWKVQRGYPRFRSCVNA